MSKLHFLIITFLIPFILIVLGQNTSCQAKKMESLSINKDETAITGEWGGEHIGLLINEENAELEFDCAHGVINQRIVFDKNGKFDFSGTYTFEHAGPVRDDQPQLSHPAVYEVAVKDKTMTLTITLSDTKKNIGTFTLTKDSRGRIMKCR